jgi:hypothetical protein
MSVYIYRPPFLQFPSSHAFPSKPWPQTLYLVKLPISKDFPQNVSPSYPIKNNVQGFRRTFSHSIVQIGCDVNRLVEHLDVESAEHLSSPNVPNMVDYK